MGCDICGAWRIVSHRTFLEITRLDDEYQSANDGEERTFECSELANTTCNTPSELDDAALAEQVQKAGGRVLKSLV